MTRSQTNEHHPEFQIGDSSAEYRPVRKYTRAAGISLATEWRWLNRGVKGGVKLRSVCIGGRRYTTDAWWAEFIAACSAPSDSLSAAHLQTPAARNRAHEQAERELDAAFGEESAPSPSKGASR